MLELLGKKTKQKKALFLHQYITHKPQQNMWLLLFLCAAAFNKVLGYKKQHAGIKMCDMDMCECVFQNDSVSLQTGGKDPKYL